MSGPERCALSALLLLLLVSAHGLVQRVHLVDVGPHDVIASWLAPLQVIGSPFAGIFQDVVGRCHLGKLAVSIWIFADVLHSVRVDWQVHRPEGVATAPAHQPARTHAVKRSISHQRV